MVPMSLVSSNLEKLTVEGLKDKRQGKVSRITRVRTGYDPT